MQYPIVAYSKNPKRDYYAYMGFHVLLRKGLLLLVIVAALALWGVIDLVRNEFFGLFYLVLAAGIMLLLLLRYFIISRKSYRDYIAAAGEMKMVVLTFEQSGFTCEIRYANKKSVATIHYEQIARVYDTRSHFYLHISATQVFSVSKRQIEGGRAKELSRLLRRKVTSQREV